MEDFNREIERGVKANESYDWREDYMLLGSDVVSLFLSLSADRTTKAVK